MPQGSNSLSTPPERIGLMNGKLFILIRRLAGPGTGRAWISRQKPAQVDAEREKNWQTCLEVKGAKLAAYKRRMHMTLLLVTAANTALGSPHAHFHSYANARHLVSADCDPDEIYLRFAGASFWQFKTHQKIELRQLVVRGPLE